MSTTRPAPPERPAPRAPWGGTLPYLAISLLTAALYRRVATLWWLSDDFFHFHLLTKHPATSFFFSPRSGRDLPGRMFTPLLLLSLRADWRLFGLRPGPFHLHQLAAIGAAALLLHATLRLWMAPSSALFGATLFLFGTTVGPVAAELATRHYAEGLGLALLSTIFFVRGERTRSPAFIAASAVLYLLAMSAKEIFVPLPAILALLPETRGRLRTLRAHAAALAAYPVWRIAVLGTLVGGYGLVLPAKRALPALAGLPFRLTAAIFGPGGGAGWATLAGLAVLWAMAPPRSGREWAFVAVLLAAAVLPVLPVSSELAPRYALATWIALACLAAASLERARRFRRRTAAAAALVTLALAFLSHRTAWGAAGARLRRQSAENRAFATRLVSGDVLVHPASYPAAMGELSWFRQDVLRSHGRPDWFFDDLRLLEHPPLGSGNRYWEYDASADSCRDVTGTMPARARLAARLDRPSAPLTARFEWRPGALRWRLGPYPDGGYAFVLRDGADAMAVPAEGAYRLDPQPITLRVKYAAISGWTTYSSGIVIDPTRAASVSWERRP
ncbi:MAG TPA: hypothetical protein VFS34_09960 [Thermoanaerobaculia bacterium]|nr:hypothetical protein [Thermoanaerobaculia bacterium]